MQKIFLISLVLCSLLSLKAQEYPKDYFRSPLDIPLFLSGNFGELRSNHFHAGLDIKTQGVEGLPIYAAADGFVSRIKVSPYGYGNALYISHPNGYTTVYGHLQRYNPEIQQYIKAVQYKKESFAVQLFPPPFQFPVKKGEIIAYSGNSGGSGGPHLHFEIRDSKTEHPINPLLFGIQVEDRINPDIYALTIYPLNDTSLINGSSQSKRFQATGRNGKYRLKNSSPIFLYGLFGFGIETVDRMNGVGNSYGLHNIQLSFEEEVIFEQEITEFAFSEGRYINSHIDYQKYISRRRRVQKSFVSPGNKLRIYKKLKNRGRVSISDSLSHQLTYRVSDLYGNQSELSVSLEGKAMKRISQRAELKGKSIQFLEYDQRNTIVRDNILVDMPAHVLYEDLYFEYRETAPMSGSISPTYWLHNHYTPLHRHMTVSIKLPPMEPEKKEKALIYSTTDGKHKYAEGGTWNGNNLRVKTRSFGGYAVALDTVPPKITSLSLSSGARLVGVKQIKFKIRDDFSGIENYRAEIDGKWVLMNYDAKNKMLTHVFEKELSTGEHLLDLIVKDAVGNESQFKARFYR